MSDKPTPTDPQPLLGVLRQARTALTTHLLAQVAPDGSVPGPCASRVLESALLLRLLRIEHRHPGHQDRLAGFLSTEGRATSRFDAALIGGVLAGEHTDREWVHDELLADFDHFTAARKRLLFDICLAVVGAAPFPAVWKPPATRRDNRVHWIEMIMLALKVLVSADSGRVPADDSARILELLQAGQSRGVWENHVTAHLLALLAVQATAPGHPAVAEGIDLVLACRNGDGGVPGIANLSVFCTGPAGLALARAGADRRVLERMGDYLATQQLPDGGWPFGENTTQSDVDTTSYAVSFLATTDRARYRPALKRAGGYLEGIAGEDGGFPTYVAGDPSEVGMTGGAASALGWAGEVHAATVTRAARYLLLAQKPDGTFERSWTLSEANTIWRTMWALHSVPAPQRAAFTDELGVVVTRSAGFLGRAQNDDGGWGYGPGRLSDTASTAYSVLALSAMGRTAATDVTARRGVLHLLARQEVDGGFSALPDQVAPRPLLFDAPVFADIWALLALGAADDTWRW